MTEQELREELDKLLKQHQEHVLECDRQSALLPEVDSYSSAVFRKFKQANYVRLADDQSYPPTQIQTLRVDVINLRDTELKEAGFKKVDENRTPESD